MNKRERAKLRVAKAARKRAQVAQASAVPRAEQLGQNNAGEQPHAEQQKADEKKAPHPESGIDWDTVLVVTVPVLISILLAAVALPWASHPYLSLWATCASFLLLDYLLYRVLKRHFLDVRNRKYLRPACLSVGAVVFGSSLLAHYLIPIPKAQPQPLSPAADITPKNTPEPNLEQPTLEENVETVTVNFGASGIRIPARDTEGAYTPFGVNGISPRVYVKNRKVYCDIVVTGGSASQPIEIKGNKITVRPPDWDVNSNRSAFEVVDENMNVTFQIIYRRPSHVIVSGVFPSPTMPGHNVYVGGLGVYSGITPPEGFEIKPIFKYPSWKYPGQFAEP